MRARPIGVLVALLMVGQVFGITIPDAAAMPTDDVVISEIHYKPQAGTGEEFVELTNSGTESVDISSWCFTAGFEFCFPASTILGPGARTVVTGSLVDFQTTYGGAADYEIVSGGISNGGETIELSNGLGDVVDSVSYDDEGDWPASPDGDGPSLELINLTADNNDPANWGASFANGAPLVGGTPGATNSINGGLPGAEITGVAVSPLRPNPAEDIVVDATAIGAASVDLEYVINFDAPQSMAMVDQGAGVYRATIPGQSAGDLVRYKVVSSDGVDLISDPSASDTINYHGVVVTDPTNASPIPIFEWFMADVDYDDMLENHRFDNVLLPAVVSYDGVVIDNAEVRVRGRFSRSFRRPNLKFEMPKGHLFQIPGEMDYAVDEFNIHSHNGPDVVIAWDIAAEISNPEVETFLVTGHRNGDFWGTSTYVEALDGRWRDDNGYDTGAFYKPGDNATLKTKATPAELEASYEKKERTDEDFTDLWELTQGVDMVPSDAQFEYLLDNIDIPRVIDHMAFRVVTRHWDQRASNYRLYRDTEGTQRWEMLIWDLDQIFNPFDLHSELASPAQRGTFLEKALLGYPEFTAMMNRRIRTLADEYLGEGELGDDDLLMLFDAYQAGLADDIDTTFDFYRVGKDAAGQRASFVAGLTYRRVVIGGLTRQAPYPPSQSRPIPRTQTADRPIVISEIHADAAAAGVEFVELTNTAATESFDLSGWTIAGLDDFVVPQGTVILPGDHVVFVADDTAFRGFYDATFVGGEFSGSLPDAGGLLELFDADGALVDSVDYQTTAPWPAVARTGRALALTDVTLDNSDPANWGVSLDAGGSPGQTNVIDADPPLPPGVVVLNEWNAVASDKQLKSDGSDPTFGQVTGNGGDWFELVVTEDDLDLAGWQLRWSEAGEPSSGVLTLADDPLWASLRAGAIVTISEDQPDDVSFDPENGDWAINVQVPGAYVSGDLDVTNDDWQLSIVDGDGAISFGPAGEGVSTGGVGSTEIGALLDDPSPTTTSTADYDDISDSSWGVPNPTDDGTTQNFSTLRGVTGASVVSGPSDVTAVEGGSANFSVEVDGTAPVMTQWRRDGVAVPGETGLSLTVAAVTVADDGAVFDVVVTNAGGSVLSGSATLTIESPPSFTAQPVDVTAVEGTAAVFAVEVDDAESVSVQWRRDGVVLPGETGLSLTLASVALADDGAAFDAVATKSGASTTSASAVLSVLPAGITVVGDPTVTVVERLEKLEVSWDPVGGATLYQLRYRPDGQSRKWISPTTDLSLNLLGLTGGLTHTVEVRAYTTSWGPFTIVRATPLEGDPPPPVETAPSFTLQPVDVSVAEGSSASFTVEVAGEPAPSVQWRRNGADLPGETGSTLTLASVTAADDGAVFDAVATNSVGSATSAAATLLVEAPPADTAPSFTLNPVDVTAVEGSSASFTVEVAGEPAPSVKWRRDGADLAGETGLTLTLASVSAADDGAVIDAVATNTVGSVTSTSATLQVTEAGDPTGITVEGEPTVTVVPAFNKLEVSWTAVDGATLYQVRYRPDGQSRKWKSPTTELSVTVFGLTGGLAHTVEVRAYTTSWGPFTLVSATPLADEPPPPDVAPSFTLEPVDATAVEGGSAVFAVAVDGDPAPSVQWRRDGVELPGETGLTLTLSGVTAADAGAVFDAVATNAAGSATSAGAALTVQVAPSFVADPAAIVVTEGDDATFFVAVTGDPVPSVQWRRDGVDLSGETGLSLTVPAVALADDSAAFDVVATNSAGSVTSAAALLTVQPAGITVEGDPTVTVIEGASRLMVSWSEVEGATLYQARYRPLGQSRKWKAPTTDLSVTLFGLTSDLEHTVEVRAYTTSWGPFTTVLATPR